jgi:hypothetical protein
MKSIIVSPYSRPLRNGKENSKNYPYWDSLVAILKGKGYYIIQIGRIGEREISGVDETKFGLSLAELEKIAVSCTTWISVDNFFQHMCKLVGKHGYVLFGLSDPNIFGHKENTNLLKDRKYLREKQFDIWESEPYNPEAFVSAEEAAKAITEVY